MKWKKFPSRYTIHIVVREISFDAWLMVLHFL